MIPNVYERSGISRNFDEVKLTKSYWNFHFTWPTNTIVNYIVIDWHTEI